MVCYGTNKDRQIDAEVSNDERNESNSTSHVHTQLVFGTGWARKAQKQDNNFVDLCRTIA